MKLQPIFIFSLPRAGSTLLQKLLMAHSEVDSIAEPWFLLPFVYALKPDGIMTEYGHEAAFDALRKFAINLPNGEKDIHEAIGDLALSLYGKACRGQPRYFLDKTPRYYLIIPEIAKIFQEAKFIFLFRHPLGIYSSILKTWCNNRFLYIHNFVQDLYEGPSLLSSGLEKLRGENTLFVNYERLVAEPSLVMEGIFSFLGLYYEENVLNVFQKLDLRGDMGDKSGSKNYDSVSLDSINKWKKTFNTEYRQRHARQYLGILGEKTLSVHGYPINSVLTELNGIKKNSGQGIKDRIEYFLSNTYRMINGPYFNRYIQKLKKQRKIYHHKIYR